MNRVIIFWSPDMAILFFDQFIQVEVCLAVAKQSFSCCLLRPQPKKCRLSWWSNTFSSWVNKIFCRSSKENHAQEFAAMKHISFFIIRNVDCRTSFKGPFHNSVHSAHCWVLIHPVLLYTRELSWDSCCITFFILIRHFYNYDIN